MLKAELKIKAALLLQFGISKFNLVTCQNFTGGKQIKFAMFNSDMEFVTNFTLHGLNFG